MVVRIADRVLVAMRQLALNPVPVVAAAVETGTQQMAEAMTGLAAFVAQRSQHFVHSVLAHWPSSVVASREGEGIGACQFVQAA